MGSLSNAETGVFTESFRDVPCAAKASQSRSPMRITRSVSASKASSFAPGRKAAGTQNAKRRMTSADEAFRPRQSPCLEIDLGLVEEFETIALEQVLKRDRVGRGIGLLPREELAQYF
jgi:hypothetical protein